MLIPAAKAVMLLGSLSLAAQVAPAVGAPAVGSATQWTLEAALVIAVGYLARVNAAKDTQILAMVTKVTEALTLSNQTLQAANVSMGTNTVAIQKLEQQQHELLIREEHMKRRP